MQLCRKLDICKQFDAGTIPGSRKYRGHSRECRLCLVAFRFHLPLEPPGYIPFPYNLIPYFIIGGVAAAGGAAGGVFYRRRKSKSYLIPFDHFNSLTGGGLPGGTVVTVEGNTGSGKTLLLEQLMGEDLRNDRPCVFVSP